MAVTDWNYDENDYDENMFAPLAAGDYRVRVAEIEETTSKSGLDMLRITLDTSGSNSMLWYYLVLMPDNKEMTNRNIGSFCNSFGITPTGIKGILGSVGKVGAARTIVDEYGAKVKYFINKKQQDKLPAWQEPERLNATAGMTQVRETTPFDQPVQQEELPF